VNVLIQAVVRNRQETRDEPVATEIYIPNCTREMGVRAVDRRIHLRLRLPVEVSGIDLAGQNFIEKTNTLLVAPSGAIIESSRSLGPDQEVAVRRGRRESLARVLGQAGLSEGKYVYGISFIQSDAAFWGVCFPNASGDGPKAESAFIECGRCQTQRTYLLNEIESLVLSTSRSFGLYCSCCKDATLWKIAESAPRPSEPAETALQVPMFESPEISPGFQGRDLQDELVPLASAIETHVPVMRVKNQRKHRRITMPRAKACVKSPNADEEFVDLVDVSRGGAAFRSERVYSLGCWIRIAAPCTVGASNIFVLARVVRACRANQGREYGVEYVETGG
jgi:PilZ domain